MNPSQFLLYTTPEGAVKIDTVLENETLWLSQAAMAELFGVQRPAITKHLLNIFESAELDEKVVSSILELTTLHGALAGKTQTKPVKYYNLDAIIAVGYRVNSKRATQFRIWATAILKEYIIKGFAMDDERLKKAEKWDYFDEWLARIRDIRASEKRFYQKIRDIYSTAIDYDKSSEQAQVFFKKVQNKMLWAFRQCKEISDTISPDLFPPTLVAVLGIRSPLLVPVGAPRWIEKISRRIYVTFIPLRCLTGKTAAELIESRSNPALPNMGLTTWQGSIVRKGDVSTTKNYLQVSEIQDLNEIVTMYLDYAERQARQRKTVTMEQWATKLDAFLTFNEHQLLTHAGKVKAEVAKAIAEQRYEEFNQNRKAAEALAADQEDLHELEELEQRLWEHKKL